MANEEITTGNAWSVTTSRDPTAEDSDYPIFFGWWNTETQDLFFIVDNTPDNAVWKQATLT